MALMVDQSSFKHFCKICKKGFGCGRALGGHMRAHGIGDENTHIDDEETGSDWEDKLDGKSSPTNKRMYALRTNPNRLKSCRVCENCGKEFLSWKSFLEHGKCSSEDAESLISSPGSDGEDERRGCGGWSKRKRSMRAKVGNFNSFCPSSEEEDLANCLMMLSNAAYDPLAEPEESCASASKDEERRNPMNFIAPIASYRPAIEKAKGVATKGLFECKACKKVFNSHQALGGHRASHKKVKGCFAARLDQGLEDSVPEEDVITQEEFFPTKTSNNFQFDHGSSNPSTIMASTSKRKSKVHECSICHRVFSSGQALGGHKRCHWITSNSPDPSSLAKFHHFQDHIEQIQKRPKFVANSETLDLTLDLNLPAPPADEHNARNGGGRRIPPANPSSFEVSTEIYLKTYDNGRNRPSEDQINKDNNINNNNNKSTCNGLVQKINSNNVDDEADSKVKLTKLCELKDTGINGNSSPWLQVGIGSATDVGVDP